ncbi:UDP-3-O-(3-hydroxymyristoyl)glucosamine N-acyltransferase [Cardinium endosymbiont of Culicoides punctatus]|uniref:UDP-3-O-(3-hydroxymyristoyl)glucosamine N-acyltransferase n=1 Tax=Cardinium endosymbiont of Culicoides punctatus TaxID=2304601 RepID=UPI0010584DDD|nr:UDP-3-O-(3-hydroxymyristoyl)glucosamine N-acyltransferase [Cardinium endosymbiont of Culicoides punctatus]TDG95572.1 UDP-3-O-acylglucosamine N-acyltransferase [Cardinium endosymbiont of Culicoides punctatus]
MQWNIAELQKRFHANLIGSATIEITHLCTLEDGMAGGLSFFSNPQYATAFYKTNASAVFVHKDFSPTTVVSTTLLRVDNPYSCFCALVDEVYQQKMIVKSGIEFPSYMGEQSTIGNNMYRGAFSYIGDHAIIGENVKIYPHVYIGDHVTIGDDTVLYSGSKIFAHTVIGNRCVIHAGAVVGSAGFGFLTNTEDVYKRIPSIGNVVLEDDVEIGANTTIDAAMVGKTIIGQGTKIDNLVQLAHNVHIGKHGGIAAQVGIAGSTKIGNYCRLGGQTGIGGHLNLGDYVTALGRAGITRSFKNGHIVLSGTPAFEHKQFLSCYARFKQMSQLPKKDNHDDEAHK